MSYPLHELHVGQSLTASPDDYGQLLLYAKHYQRRWRKLGWSYVAGKLPDGSLAITRLPDTVGIAPNEASMRPPAGMEDVFFKALEASVIRVFEKIINDSVDGKQKLAGMRHDYAENGFVPNSVIRNYCTKLAPFKTHPMGPGRSFELTLENLIRKQIFVSHMHASIKGVMKGSSYES